MLSRNTYNLYNALQVTLNVNIQIWRRNLYEFSPETVLPVNFVRFKKYRGFVRYLVLAGHIWSRYFWWMFLPLVWLQIFCSVLLLPFLRRSRDLENTSGTVLFNGTGRFFQTYSASGRKDEAVIFDIDPKRFNVPADFTDCRRVSFWSFLKAKDIFLIFPQWFTLLLMMHRHHRQQYVMLQAFKLLLVQKALHNYPDLQRIIFCNADRWSYICAAIPQCKAVFMQHGLLSAKLSPLYFPHKWHGISLFYGYSSGQAEIASLFIRKIDKFEYFKPQIQLSPIKVPEGKHSVLLIGCSMLFADKETEIIEKYAQKDDVVLYIKPHPSFTTGIYWNLKEKYNFIFIEDKKFFPDVDQVISYESTLAYEYQLCGKEVFIHSTL